MLIIYTSILDHILKIQEQAEGSGRTVDYLVLTESEVKELNRDLGPSQEVKYNPEIIMGTLFGIKIVGLKYHTDLLKGRKYGDS